MVHWYIGALGHWGIGALAHAHPAAVALALTRHQESLGVPCHLMCDAEALEAVEQLAGEVGVVGRHGALQLFAEEPDHLG